MLSRKEMEDIIVNQRLSVYIEGHGIIDSVSKLPSEAVLAKGDKQAEKEAKASIKAQMESLKQQLELLDEPAVEEEEEDKDNGEVDTAEADAQDAILEARAEAAVKAEETRKAEEAKKAAAVKKEADAKNK